MRSLFVAESSAFRCVKTAVSPKIPPMFKFTLPMNILLCLSWLWLYRPVFSYLQVIFQREDFRTNQIVLLLLIVILVMQIWDGNKQTVRQSSVQTFTKFFSPPQKNHLPILLLLGTSIAFLIAERWLDVNTI